MGVHRLRGKCKKQERGCTSAFVCSGVGVINEGQRGTMSIPDFGPAHDSPSPGLNGRRLRSNSPLNLSLDADDTNSYLYVLQSASEECVRGLFSLQKVAPTIALTSVFAEDVHTLLYTVGNVEVALHQFVDRELVGAESLHRRREQGATLQDAIKSARTSRARCRGLCSPVASPHYCISSHQPAAHQ